MACAALLAVPTLACGGALPPSGDFASAYFRAGVEPSAELDAAIGLLERAGYRIERRIDEERFAAASLTHPDRRSALRIATRRGITLAVDAPSLDHTRARVELEGTRDLDRDGAPELVVRALDAATDTWCLGVFVVDDAGFLVERRPRVPRLGATPCLEAPRDADGDGRPEPILTLRWHTLGRGEAPTLSVPLAPDGSLGASAAYWDAALEERAGREGDARYRAAIELAALARLRGDDREAQLAAFDRVAGEAQWNPTQREDLARARAFIASGWGDAAEAGEP